MAHAVVAVWQIVGIVLFSNHGAVSRARHESDELPLF